MEFALMQQPSHMYKLYFETPTEIFILSSEVSCMFIMVGLPYFLVLILVQYHLPHLQKAPSYISVTPQHTNSCSPW